MANEEDLLKEFEDIVKPKKTSKMEKRLNLRRFLNLIDGHKMLCVRIAREIDMGNIKNGGDNPKLFVPLLRTGRELALIKYILNHGKENLFNLQFHHLIRRSDKKFIPFSQYVKQRHYFENIAVIKQKDHKHNFMPEGEAVMTREFIDYILKEYFSKEDKNDRKVIQ